MKRTQSTILGLLALVSGASADTHVLFNWDLQMSHYDSVSRKLIRTIAAQRVDAAAQSEDGDIVVDSGAALYRVNPATGAFTLLTATIPDIRGLAFRDGVLYAVQHESSGSMIDNLYTIDLATGAATLVGPTGFLRVQALATAPDGTLYGWDVFLGLLKIDHTNGAGTLVGVTPAHNIQTLEFDRFGVLWGAGPGVVCRINRQDGQYKVVSTAPGDVRGMVIPKTQGIMLCSDGVVFGSIDLATGFKTTTTRQTGASMAPRKDGTLWGFITNRLRNVDPGNGGTTQIGDPQNNILAMTWVGNTLYGLMSANSQPLVTIDPATGVHTTVFATGRPANSLTSLTTAPDGTLYAYDASLGLVTIDPVGHTVDDVNTRAGADSRIAAIEFGQDGRLYGGKNELFALDPDTGLVSHYVGGSAYTGLTSMGSMPFNGFAMGIGTSAGIGTYRIDFDALGATAMSSTNNMHGLTLSPEGTILAINNTEVRTVDRATGALGPVVFSLPSAVRRGLAFGDDDRLISAAVSGSTRRVDFFDRPGGGLDGSVTIPLPNDYGDLCSTRDGSLFAMVHGHGPNLVDPTNGTYTQIDSTPDATNWQSMILLPDGRMFATSGIALCRVDLATGDTPGVAAMPVQFGGMVWTPPTTQGTIVLGDYVASPDTQVVEVTLRHPGTSTILETHYPRLAADGTVQFASLLFGTYDVFVKGSHWLRKRVGSATIGAAGNSFTAQLLTNGDVDGDNEITVGDYAQLSAAFGSVPGDPHWNPMADLDGDDEVTIGDFAILSTNFGEVGED